MSTCCDIIESACGPCKQTMQQPIESMWLSQASRCVTVAPSNNMPTMWHLLRLASNVNINILTRRKKPGRIFQLFDHLLHVFDDVLWLSKGTVRYFRLWLTGKIVKLIRSTRLKMYFFELKSWCFQTDVLHWC